MDWTNPRKIALFLDLFVAFILRARIHALGYAGQCHVFKVQRGTIHKAFISKSLKISCNLKYCDDQIISVRWSKNTMTDWIPVSETNQTTSSQSRPASNLLTSHLTFTNLSMDHEGLYRCELWLSNISTVSHYINVSISEDGMGEAKYCTEMINESSNTDTSPWWWPYLFISSGLVILVLTVMLFTFLCIHGFKSSGKKNKKRAQVKYTASLSPDVQNRSEFDSIQYSEDSLPQEQSVSHSSDCGGDYYLSNRKGSRSSQVVYASLHHLAATASSTTPCQMSDECSEYAAIRIS